MKNSKKVLLALFIAASASSFSSVSLAGDDGRISYAPAQAMDMVVEKLKQADAAITAGASNEAIVAELQQAKDATKEVNASDKVSFKLSKARDSIKKAILEAKNGHSPEAAALIKQAVSGMAEAKAAI